MSHYNVHTHIFTMQNAPKDFLHLYLPGFAANLVDNVTSTQAGSNLVQGLLRLAGNGGRKYASFLSVGKSAHPKYVFNELLSAYDNDDVKIVALTLYMERLGAGSSESGYEGQLEQVLEVLRMHDTKLLPFLGVDPRWKGNGVELCATVQNYFNTPVKVNEMKSVNPFYGLKFYPSTGFYFFDERLKETLTWAAAHGVPLLTHCSYLGGIYNNDRDYLLSHVSAFNVYTGKNHPAPAAHHKLEKKIFRRMIGVQKSKNNLYYSSYFLEPESYRSVLTYFRDVVKTPLKLCFAHFGSDEHMVLQGGNENLKENLFGVLPRENWAKQIQNLMLEFDTVYTDISYSLTNKKTHDFIFNELNKSYGNRILFGTDYYMTEREGKERDTYNAFKAKALQKQITLNGVTQNAWDMIAGTNVQGFLKSGYFGS